MSAHQEASNIHDIAGALRRRWKMITALGLVAAFLAAAVGFILPPRYTAKSQIVLEIPGTPTTLGWLDDAAVETRVQLLMSGAHLKRLHESLASDTEHPAAARISYDVLEHNLNVYKEIHSRVIAVTYTDNNPEIAAFVANKSAELYLDTLADQSRSERGDIKALDAQIPAVRAQVQRAKAAVQAYRAASISTGSKVADSSGKTIQPTNRDARLADAKLRDLEREAAAATQFYDNLVKRRQDLASQEVPPPEVRIASVAIPPEQPSSLNPLLFLPPALVFALIMGAFLAITLERLDTTVRNQQDVANALGIPCVALIPKYEGASLSRWYSRKSPFKGGPAAYLSFLKNPFSPYSEAIRSTVISTLEQAQKKGHPQTVIVTSSVQGEGKTTLAVSFATYAAQLGRKVLLIDFDFRKPGVLEHLAGSDETGTLELLAGHPAADLIKHHAELGIDYLPLPRHWIDPLPLLQCPNLPELLQQLRGRYDCVVIDSAPLLGTTETRLLSMMADKVVLAVRWGSTRQDIMQHAFRQLQTLGETHDNKRAVAVITRVDLKLHSRYRFGDVGEVLVRFPYPQAQARQI